MTLIETHAHLYLDAFDKDRKEMIERAKNAGVDKFFLPAIDSTETKNMYALESEYPDNMFLMTGLHPVSVGERDYKEEIAFIEDQLAQRRFYAIGEIGIDLHWHPETLEQQKEAFRQQIHLAKKHKLPIVIHCRKAFDEVFEILEDENDADLFGIFHCFTGTLKQAKQAIALGLKLGIGGIVTFKNGKIDKFLNQVPLEEIVLETDAPYLAPTPYRGKRNESSYLINTAEKLAAIYNTTLEEIAKQTTKNATTIFGIE